MQKQRQQYINILLFVISVATLLGGCSPNTTLDQESVNTPSPQASSLPTAEANMLSTQEVGTATPTQIAITKTPTSQPTEKAQTLPSPTPTSKPVIDMTEELLLSYATFDLEGESRVATIWKRDIRSGNSEKLIEFEGDNGLFSPMMSWSNNGKYIAFENRQYDHMLISILNTETLEIIDITPQYPISYTDMGTTPRFTLYQDSWSKDDKWLYATMHTIDVEKKWVINKDVIFNIEHPIQAYKLDENEEFVVWSSLVAEQYLYLSNINANMPDGRSVIHIGDVGTLSKILTLDMLTMWSGISSRQNISVSFKNNKILSTSFDGLNRSTNYIIIDISLGSEILLDYKPSGHGIPFDWSPDGKLILVGQSNGFYFWEIHKNDEPQYRLPLIADFGPPYFWLRDTNLFFYRDGSKLFLVDPYAISEKQMVFDLNSLNIDSDLEVGFIVWHPLRGFSN